MSRVILGIDPGLAIVGYGVLSVTSRDVQQVLAVGVIRTAASLPMSDRLLQINKHVDTLIGQYEPDLVAVEKLYFGKNVKTAMSVSEARGVVLLSIVEKSIPVVEYTPLQIKTALTGYGRADKRQMQMMVKTLLGLKDLPQPDDAADALAVALTAAVSYNEQG